MKRLMKILVCVTALAGLNVTAGPLDPECTAGKAAKSTAMKATVGVGGRCSPKEAASDSAKRTVGIEDKGPLKKKRKNESTAKKAAKKIVD